MSVNINKTGEIEAIGDTIIRNKNGSIISNVYEYQHGYVEDENIDNNAIILYDDYIVLTEVIEC